MSEYLFVYGTLLRESDNEFSHFLSAHSTAVGEAFFQGKLYIIDWYPGMVASDNPKDKVRGELIKLDDHHEKLFHKLDLYEGVSDPPSKNDEYKRQKIRVKSELGDTECWAYIYQGSKKGLNKIISGDFRDD